MATQVLRYGERSGTKYFSPALEGPAAVIRYSRAAVGNDFESQKWFNEPKPPAERYSSSSNGMLGPDDIRQIVQALESLDWVQWVKEQMKIRHGNNGTAGEPEAPDVDDLDVPAGRQKREQYARDRRECEQYHRVARHLKRDSRDSAEQYALASQADQRYRESRQAIAERIRRFAEVNHCSWDEARDRCGEQLPLAMMGSAVA